MKKFGIKAELLPDGVRRDALDALNAAVSDGVIRRNLSEETAKIWAAAETVPNVRAVFSVEGARDLLGGALIAFCREQENEQMSLRREWRNAELFGAGGKAGLFERIEGDAAAFFEHHDSFKSLATALADRPSEREQAAAAAIVASRKFGDAVLAVADLLAALSKLKDELPPQSGGRGSLTYQLARNPFLVFAEVFRDCWRAADFSIGGNGKENDGFEDALEAIHYKVTGRKIKSKADILSALRAFPKGSRR